MIRLIKMAVRNVGRNKRRSLVTGAAIVFGVVAVLMLRGFTRGSAVLMTNDVVKGRSGAIQVHRAGFVRSTEASPARLNMPYDEAFLNRLKRVEGVTGATGRIQFQGLITNGTSQTMVVGRGVDLAHEKETCPWNEQSVVPGGEALVPGDDDKILIGFELAQSFNLGTGKTASVQTSSPGGRANAMGLTIKGLTASNLPFENKRVATVTLKTAQALLGLEGRVTEYALAIADVDRAEEVAATLRQELGADYEVHTWKELQPFVRDIINRQAIVLSGISFVLFFIVLTGIVNTMLMSVFERVREIGTLLAVGVRRRQVMQIFLAEATTIGLVGGVTGAVIGKTILAVLSVRGIPLQLAGTTAKQMLRPEATAQFAGLAIVISVVGAVLASAWPAWKASRLNPVEALRST
jgi:putative ABC transport system permease protein